MAAVSCKDLCLSILLTCVVVSRGKDKLRPPTPPPAGWEEVVRANRRFRLAIRVTLSSWTQRAVRDAVARLNPTISERKDDRNKELEVNIDTEKKLVEHWRKEFYDSVLESRKALNCNCWCHDTRQHDCCHKTMEEKGK